MPPSGETPNSIELPRCWLFFYGTCTLYMYVKLVNDLFGAWVTNLIHVVLVVAPLKHASA